eukprot:6329501-Amphidinium_carterae.1
MGDDVRAIDDGEALRVWSELSELDPKIRGDKYVSEDGSQWNFSDLAALEAQVEGLGVQHGRRVLHCYRPKALITVYAGSTVTRAQILRRQIFAVD